NVELDEPVRRRRAAIEKLRETHGRLTPDPAEPPVANSPFDLAWWLRGERGGRVKVELLLNPQAPPLVQAMDLTSVPEPPAELRAAAERICAALAMADDRAPVWPAELALADGVDAAELARAMRAAEARFG